MWWLAASTTTTVTSSLLLRRLFNKSVSSKSCRAALIHHQTSFFNTTTTTFNSSPSSSSSNFGGGGGGTFILHDDQQAANNNLHTTTSSTSSSSSSSSSSKFGTIILQTNEPSDDLGRYYGEEKDEIIKMFMLSSSGSDGEEEDKDKDDDDQKKKKKKKKKKEKMVFKLDEDLGFSAIYKDFQLEDSICMVGSCNGIICLHDPMSESLWDVYLWNPATRQFKILPGANAKCMEEPMLGCEFIGFGFDDETQDYKVLRITPLEPDSYREDGGDGDECRCLVQVYSLSTDSWRVLDGIDSLPVSPTQDQFQNSRGTYLNGSCFFLGSKPINHNGIRDLMMLSFDFTKEIFTNMELPGCYCHKLVFRSSGEEYIDDVLTSPRVYDIRFDEPFSTPRCHTRAYKLVVYRTPRKDFAGGYVFTTVKIDLDDDGYWYYKMWVLNGQHGSGRVVEDKEESWTQLHYFRIKTESKHPYCEPRCVSNDRKFALISTNTGRKKRKKLMLFNLVTGKAIKDFTIGDRDCRAAYVYKESQVSIMGGGNALLRWQLPTHGTTYKLNLDAHYTGDYTTFGIGLCLTSDTGGCIGVRSVSTSLIDPEEGKAKAMFEAIKWADELGLSPIIIESDSKNMVSFFMEDDDNNLLTYWSSEYAHSVLEDAKHLLKSSENSISFQYCSRSSNYVAEMASKLGRDWTNWRRKDWTANFPGEVVMSLSKDLGLETT